MTSSPNWITDSPFRPCGRDYRTPRRPASRDALREAGRHTWGKFKRRVWGESLRRSQRLLPQADIAVIERCSGHGGSWGVLKGNFETAVKVGRPVARQAIKKAKPFVASECPLAGMHIVQELEMLADGEAVPPRSLHPIELVARAYGIPGAWSDP